MLKSKKILFVIDSLCSGGAQRQLVNLAIGLKEKGYLVEFLIYYSDPFYEEYLELNNVQITLIGDESYFKRIYKIVSFIKNGDFRTVISFLEGANFMTSVAKMFCKNTTLIVGERSSNPNILKSFKLKYVRYFHLLADYVVANSVANLELVTKAVPLLLEKKKKVIYNMIDFDEWKVENNLSIFNDKNDFVIIVPATHQYVKNLNGLIEAVNLLDVDLKERLKIKWFGADLKDGSYNEGKRSIEKYNLENNFVFYGPTKKIKNEMEKCDVIGLFSIYEGLPNAICEGMALGKPVICSDISDMHLFVEKEFLFDPLNYNSIAEKIKHIMNFSSEELVSIGACNHRVAVENFAKEKVISEYVNLIESKNNV